LRIWQTELVTEEGGLGRAVVRGREVVQGRLQVLVDKDLRLLRKVGQAVPHDAIVGRSYAPQVSTASSDGEGQ